MCRLLALSVLAVFVLTAVVVGPPVAAADETPNATSTPEIAGVYPDPVADGDAGEFVVLTVPNGTDLGEYRLADDEGGGRLPSRTASGRVVVTANRSRVPDVVEGPIIECPGFPALANTGETVALSRPEGRLDSVSYTDTSEGEILRPEGDRQWRPLGATAFQPVEGEADSVRAFVLPDTPGAPVDIIANADRRVMLAGYTLTSDRVTEALIAARERGVTVEVLIEGAPVGGLTERSAHSLDRLAAANVSVRVLGGEYARYRFHHAKYAVADDRAVVLTENWKPAGVGGASSRGWGVVLDSPAVVGGLVRTFRADNGFRDAVPWRRFRRGERFEPASPSNGRYPSRIDPKSVAVERIELLLAPDNAAGRVQRLLANATESIRVVQVSIGGREDPLLRETIDAARSGVDVDILLSGAWYVREDNRRLARQLRTLAEREGLPLSVRLADPGGRYEKVHAKGVIVDGDAVVLGSLNWNENAYRHNREVALVLHGEDVGSYFEAVFERDWRGGITLVPVGLLVVAVLALLLAGTVARRIEFAR